jgi:drug/metabolite transporter (DMT)-like permease
MFWLFSLLGSAAVGAFALSNDGTVSPAGDFLMIAAVVLCGLGYAEGAVLSRRLGGWQVISWALLLASPVMLLLAVATCPPSWQVIKMPAWLGLAYVSTFSMLVGFVFWYRGLARGGIASVGQLQLLQPFLGFALAGLLLHEPVAWSMILATGLVVVCVALARRYA